MADRPALSLKKALETGQLEAFIAQAEDAGLGHIDTAEFDDTVRRVARERRLEGQTSHSPSPDGLTGK